MGGGFPGRQGFPCAVEVLPVNRGRGRRPDANAPAVGAQPGQFALGSGGQAEVWADVHPRIPVKAAAAAALGTDGMEEAFVHVFLRGQYHAEFRGKPRRRPEAVNDDARQQGGGGGGQHRPPAVQPGVFGDCQFNRDAVPHRLAVGVRAGELDGEAVGGGHAGGAVAHPQAQRPGARAFRV